jgi:hypothetical protein
MLRLGCLNNEKSIVCTSAASASELFQQLQSLFVGSEIVYAQQRISCYYCDQSEVFKIESFGNNLGTNEDVNLSGGKGLYGLLFVCLVLSRVAVQSCDFGVREQLRGFFLDLLGAGTEWQ